jgi:hypothetical protein
MAKLSTPSHACFVEYTNSLGDKMGQHCPRSAYRKDSAGRWACRQHNDKLTATKARQAAQGRTMPPRPAQPMFVVVGTGHVTR